MRQVALTFDGNPKSPIDDFDSWWSWDPIKAQKTCSALARAYSVNPDLPPDIDEYFKEQAIDEICEDNITGYFKKYEKYVKE